MNSRPMLVRRVSMATMSPGSEMAITGAPNFLATGTTRCWLAIWTGRTEAAEMSIGKRSRSTILEVVLAREQADRVDFSHELTIGTSGAPIDPEFVRWTASRARSGHIDAPHQQLHDCMLSSPNGFLV